jgi:hypothetical protein
MQKLRKIFYTKQYKIFNKEMRNPTKKKKKKKKEEEEEAN